MLKMPTGCSKRKIYNKINNAQIGNKFVRDILSDVENPKYI